MGKFLLVAAVAVFAVTLTAVTLPSSAEASPGGDACWGQATAAFADSEQGIIGEHSSNQTQPRLGLRNLARELFKAGVIPDDSMESLGVFVAAASELEVDACK